MRTTRLPMVTLVDSEAGCVKLHGMLQYPALARSFAYTLVDMFLARSFPDADLSVFGLPHHPIGKAATVGDSVGVGTGTV